MKKMIGFIVLLILSCKTTSSGTFSAANGQTDIRLVPGELYFETVEKLLEGVDGQSTIDVLHYNFVTENEGPAKKLAQRLLDLKKKFPTLKLRIVVEGEGEGGNTDGVASRNKKLVPFFAGTDTQIAFISGSKVNTSKSVTHAKSIRINDQLLAGSTNLTNTSISKNNEFNVLVNDKTIIDGHKQFVDALVADYKKLVPLRFTSEDKRIAMLTDDLFFNELMTTLDGAQKGDRIDLTTYFFRISNDTDVKGQAIFNKLVELVTKREVDLRLYLERADIDAPDNRLNRDITLANMDVAKAFLAKNVRTVYFDPKDKISHSKLVLWQSKDGKRKKILVGSANLYERDLSENHQISFSIEDAALFDRLMAYQNQKFAYEGTNYLEATNQGREPTMLRFWRGFKQDQVSYGNFVRNLNSKLIRQTIVVGEKRGLTGYLPVLTTENAPEFIPTEVALVAYRSRNFYDAIRSTPEGAKYGPLHFEDGLFARKNAKGFESGSIVATEYQGNALKVNSVARLGSEFHDWQKSNNSMFFVTGVDAQLSQVRMMQDYLQSNMDALEISSVLTLIDANYLIVLVGWSPNKVDTGNLPLPQHSSLKVMQSTEIQKVDWKMSDVRESGGNNLQFNSGLMSAKEAEAVVLDTFK